MAANARAPEELYGLPLEEFTPARDALAKELKAAGRKEEAAEVKALRKPSLAAWALNRAARDQPDAVEALRSAGADLRQAQQEALSGDAGRLREASRALSDEIDRVATLAADALRSAGRPATAAQQEKLASTLRTAAVDDGAGEALARGVLADELGATGFSLLGSASGDWPPPLRPRRATAGAPAARPRATPTAVTLAGRPRCRERTGRRTGERGGQEAPPQRRRQPVPLDRVAGDVADRGRLRPAQPHHRGQFRRVPGHPGVLRVRGVQVLLGTGLTGRGMPRYRAVGGHHTEATRAHEHGIDIDLRNAVGVIGDEIRQSGKQPGRRVQIERRTGHAVEPGAPAYPPTGGRAVRTPNEPFACRRSPAQAP